MCIVHYETHDTKQCRLIPISVEKNLAIENEFKNKCHEAILKLNQMSQESILKAREIMDFIKEKSKEEIKRFKFAEDFIKKIRSESSTIPEMKKNSERIDTIIHKMAKNEELDRNVFVLLDKYFNQNSQIKSFDDSLFMPSVKLVKQREEFEPYDYSILILGPSGSGKSSFINTFINILLEKTPDNLLSIIPCESYPEVDPEFLDSENLHPAGKFYKFATLSLNGYKISSRLTN